LEKLFPLPHLCHKLHATFLNSSVESFIGLTQT
jgi:hypothetical protein